MIEILNRLIDEIEARLGDELDVDALASDLGTTGYHARRMFSSLAGMPVSEYVRRRRVTVAASDVIGDEDLLTIAVRYGYGSTEAFGRAFRAVHGVSHGDVRRDGGPPSQPTEARVPPDRRREHLDGCPNRPTARLPPDRTCRPRAAHLRAVDFSTATCELWLPVERD